jgi:hypothetical protein
VKGINKDKSGLQFLRNRLFDWVKSNMVRQYWKNRCVRRDGGKIVLIYNCRKMVIGILEVLSSNM